MTPNLAKEMQIALAEIGEIKPWFSEDDGAYIFEHPAYPWVIYIDDTPRKTKRRYVQILRYWIQERRKGRVADFCDKSTPGKAGLCDKGV